MHRQLNLNQILPHRATLQLLRCQATARVHRALHSFRGRRRMFLSAVAVVLAVVWLGQVIAGVLLREPADPNKLSVWIPLGLLAYSLWHLLKAACRTPLEPFEWTPAERELLGGAPLRRRDLVLYRLTAIAMAAVAKAVCFALVMLPDLHVWTAGLAGMLMALLFIDFLRLVIEIFVYGMSRQAFQRFRFVVLAMAGICVATAVLNALPFSVGPEPGELPTALAIGWHLMQSLMDLRTTWLGTIVEWPFRLFAGIMLAPQWSLTLVAQMLGAAGLVAVLGECVVRWDMLVQRRRSAAERREFEQLSGIGAPSAAQPDHTRDGQPRDRGWPSVADLFPISIRRNREGDGDGERWARFGNRPAVRVPVRMRGAGSLAWRQALGVMHYRTSVGVALLVPGFLSCLTLLTPQAGNGLLIQLVGGLVFYSFLLLPTALKFDFRRDIDRLGVLKSLPLSPLAVTLGQLAVPVLLCTMFQMVVLLIALLARPYHPLMYLAALLVLLPTNVLIFSLENLIFLLYPYRLNQEGLGIFVRSILAFTAKSVMFVIGLVIALIWALISRQLSGRLMPGSDVMGPSLVFSAGIWMLVTAAALGTTALLTRVYRGFDPSQDAPAVS